MTRKDALLFASVATLVGAAVATEARRIRRTIELEGRAALFDAALFSALGSLVGEHGARDFIAADPGRVTMVDVAEPPPMDIDTPSDYDELLKRQRR